MGWNWTDLTLQPVPPVDQNTLQRALRSIRQLRAKVDSYERAASEPLAIVGMACRLPGGSDSPEAFWDLLAEGRDVVTELPPDRIDLGTFHSDDPSAKGTFATRHGAFLDGIDQFAPRFFGISASEASRMDPQQRLLLELAQETIDDAGWSNDALAGEPAGVFVGLSTDEYGWLSLSQRETTNNYTATGSFGAVAANRISYVYDLRGPSYTVDAVCSSSLLALHLAGQSLRSGECNLAFVGGVGLALTPSGILWFDRLGVMSPDGRCRAFDARGDGIVLGEGAVMIAVKRLSDARADGDYIHALVRGSAVAQDGRSNGMTAPSSQAQSQMLRDAYRQAGIDPSDVHYVEAHGTGTELGDPIEAHALGSVVGAGRPEGRPCYLGSVKTNIGHLQMVGGLAGLLKTVLAMQHRRIPATVHFESPNPHIPFDDLNLAVSGEPVPWPYEGPAIAGVTSISFGGTNVHVVLEEAPADREVASTEPASDEAATPTDGLLEGWTAVTLTAHDAATLDATAERWAAWLGEAGQRDLPALEEIGYTTRQRRTHHSHRLVVPARTTAGLAAALTAYRDGEPGAPVASGQTRQGAGRVCFVFSGVGGYWVGMGRRMWAAEGSPFRAAFDRCAVAFAETLGEPLTDILHRPLDARREAVAAQALLFACQVGISAQWEAWGVRPDAVLGQSAGEAAAAYVAGALSLEDAARVIAVRSALAEPLDGGAMAVVQLPVEQVWERIEAADTLEISVFSSPTTCIVSGEADEIERFVRDMTAENVFSREVQIGYASHSPAVDPVLVPLRERLSGLAPSAGTIPIYTTVAGGLVDGATLDGAYWARNLRDPVHLSRAVEALVADGYESFVEVSPHPILTTSVDENLRHAGSGGTTAPSWLRDEDEVAVMLRTAGHLFATGYPLRWTDLFSGDAVVRPPVPVPRYAWQRESYWIEGAGLRYSPGPSGGGRTPGAAAPTAPGVRPPRTALVDVLAAAHPSQRQARLVRHTQGLVAEALALPEGRLPSATEGFFQMGMNSTQAVELKGFLERDLDLSLPSTVAFEQPSITVLASFLLGELGLEAPPPPGPPRTSAPEVDVPGAPLSDDDFESLFDAEMQAIEKEIGR